MRTLNVGNYYGTNYGTGTIQFLIAAAGVSPIVLTSDINAVNISTISGYTTNLLVSGTPTDTSANILLIDNQGSSAVIGSFNFIGPNSSHLVSAAEGAAILLGSHPYTLTYMYDSVSKTVGTVRNNTYNDIALIPQKSVTIPTPAVNSGDLLIAAAATDEDTSASIAAHAGQGWTLIDRGASGGNVTLAVWWKIAGSSEPNSYTFSWTGAAEQAYGWMMRFSGSATNPINGTPATYNDSSSTPISPAVTTTINNCLILRMGAFDDNSVTVGNPGLTGHTAITMNKSSSTAGSGVVCGGAGYLKQSTAGSSGTSTFSLTAVKSARTLTLAIAPANTGTSACCEDDITP
jgi:hypothetical protein